jgi:O-antigen ligase
MEDSQTKISGGRLLAAGAVAVWLLTSEQIARINPQTTLVILVVFVLVLFIFLSKSLYDRLAWALAFQALGFVQMPVFGIRISLPDIMLVFLLLDASLARQLRKQGPSPMGLLAIAILIAACISVLLSPVILSILGVSIRYAILLLLFIALDRIAFPETALRTLRVGMAVTLPLALILFYFNGDLLDIISSIAAGSRPTHSQSFPYFFTLVFPWYLLAHRRIVPLALLGCIYAMSTWLAQSRGMNIMAFATLATILVVKLKRNLLSLLVLVTVAVVGLAGVYEVGIDSAVETMASRPASDDWRLYKMRASMEVFREHPILGVGPGGEFAMTGRRHEEGLASENGFVQSLADLGLLGTLLFVAMALYPLWRGYHLAKRGMIGRDLAGALMIIFVAAIAPLSWSSTVEGGAVWLLLAVINKHLGRRQSDMSIEAPDVALHGIPS